MTWKSSRTRETGEWGGRHWQGEMRGSTLGIQDMPSDHVLTQCQGQEHRVLWTQQDNCTYEFIAVETVCITAACPSWSQTASHHGAGRAWTPTLAKELLAVDSFWEGGRLSLRCSLSHSSKRTGAAAAGLDGLRKRTVWRLGKGEGVLGGVGSGWSKYIVGNS